MITALASLAVTVFARIGWAKIAEFALNVYTQRTARLEGDAKLAADVRKAELQAAVDTAREGTARQTAKMSYPVFWFIILAALGPGVLTMWSLWLYNILWWEHGVWPQPWSIAAYPPQAAAWVDMSIRWLFDPVGLSSTVGTAWLAGRAAGGRK